MRPHAVPRALSRLPALLLAGLPVADGATIPTTASFGVGATVQRGCLVSGDAQPPGASQVFGEIGFGSFPALTTGRVRAALGPAGGVQALLSCTAGTAAQLTLDAGLYADGGQRRLSAGNGYYLSYQLLLNTGGDQPLPPGVPLGVAIGDTPQALPLQGELLLPGTGVGAGSYRDTVQLTVSW